MADALDIYRQRKLESIEARLKANSDMQLSEPVLWKGGLDHVLETVRLLQHRSPFPEKRYQVKFNADVNALRLSDYTTRAVAEPGEYFFLLDDIILSGDLDEHVAWQAKLAAARETTDADAVQQ